MSWDIILTIALVLFFIWIVLKLPFQTFDDVKDSLADQLIDRLGLFDLYFELCTTQSLEMIQQLRHFEDEYRESLVDLLSETLTMPEMLLLFVFGNSTQDLKAMAVFPNLTDQAQSIAQFYIQVVKRQLSQGAIPSGPHAHRLCSRWRRRAY